MPWWVTYHTLSVLSTVLGFDAVPVVYATFGAYPVNTDKAPRTVGIHITGPLWILVRSSVKGAGGIVVLVGGLAIACWQLSGYYAISIVGVWDERHRIKDKKTYGDSNK
ncbi:hypothetical protein N7494_007396 [Penicillium frequentans]|uniref:Uncharacterized protein n=1 Tax=Penicillium frequentans TaxID=3151616 RepID=A0AAD6CSD7_9EURO|nr:hypothetical protein N7494_007396 [Penicillium glabrum]